MMSYECLGVNAAHCTLIISHALISPGNNDKVEVENRNTDVMTAWQQTISHRATDRQINKQYYPDWWGPQAIQCAHT